MNLLEACLKCFEGCIGTVGVDRLCCRLGQVKGSSGIVVVLRPCTHDVSICRCQIKEKNLSGNYPQYTGAGMETERVARAYTWQSANEKAWRVLELPKRGEAKK